MRNSWESPEKVLRKSEKVLQSPEKSWESPEKVPRKSWESPEKVLRKSLESYADWNIPNELNLLILTSVISVYKWMNDQPNNFPNIEPFKISCNVIKTKNVIHFIVVLWWFCHVFGSIEHRALLCNEILCRKRHYHQSQFVPVVTGNHSFLWFLK